MVKQLRQYGSQWPHVHFFSIISTAINDLRRLVPLRPNFKRVLNRIATLLLQNSRLAEIRKFEHYLSLIRFLAVSLKEKVARFKIAVHDIELM